MAESEGRYNLLREPWLPVVRASGATEWILPSGVNDGIGSDPIVGFAWPRPDFNGAAHEFLIGLLSTTTAPTDEEAWEDWWLTPPSSDVLQERFDAVAHAFDLDGPGARFCQDLDPLEDAGPKRVAQLLIDAPGVETLRHNADLFVKRDGTTTLCRASAAMALYTLNAYAPSGGAGHRTSIRGGGPLTTLIVASEPSRRRTLWDRLWPNVETAEQIERRAPQLVSRDAPIFPWLAPIRTSNRKENGRLTTPSDVHPLQVYWAMPRRIRLVFEDARDRRCSLTNSKDGTVASIYRTKNYGADYSEGFEHPLTPYYWQKPGTAKLPRHAQSGSVTYRLWPSITCQEHLSAPAQVVLQWKERRPADSGEVRVATFGYDMDNMKARAWVEGEMPLHLLDDADLQEFLELFVTKAVAAAVAVTRLLTKAVKTAFRERAKDASGDYGFLAERFYRETEMQFRVAVEKAKRSIQECAGTQDDPTITARESWPRDMAPVAMRLFDEYASMDGLQDRNMERHVRARHYLALALSGRGRDGKSLFGELDVNPPQSAKRGDAASGERK